MTYRFVLVFFFGILSLLSCNDCHLVDCPTGVSFTLAINDFSTGNSLLIESDSIYNVDDMSMSSLIDGEQIEGRLFKRTSNGSDSFLISCWSNVSPDMIFITIDDQDTDTLSFMSEYIEDECCSWYRLESVSVNGANTIPILNETVTLLK